MAYLTRELSEVDTETIRSRVIELFEENRIPDPAERFEWLYCSPFARAHICTRLLYHDDLLVGIITLLPVPQGGRVLGSMVNLLVDRKHRTLGPALTLMKGLINGCCPVMQPDWIIGRPNDKADILLRRLKLQPLGSFPRRSWISNPLHYLPLPRRIARLGGQVLSPWLRGWLRVQELSASLRSGQSIDQNWELVEDPAQARALLPEYLVWRYLDIPNGRARVASLGPPRPGAPYAIFGITERGVLGIDCFEPGAPEATETLLARFMRTMIRRFEPRNFSLAVLNSPRFDQALRNLGFVLRHEDQELTVYLGQCTPDESGPAPLPSDLALFPSNLDF